MNNKNTGMIATIGTALLCGCPGLIGLCFGLISVLVSLTPGAEIDMFGSNDPGRLTSFGVGALCLSVILIAIPIVVGVVTLRKEPAASVNIPDEPLPPTS